MKTDLVIINDNDSVLVEKQHNNQYTNIFYNINIGNIIKYIPSIKQFSISGAKSEDSAFMGIVLNNDNKNYNIDVLYKGLLLKDTLEINQDTKEFYIQTYIDKSFKHIKETIKSRMPRCKKLKRLNLKLLNKDLCQILYNNLDDIIDNYRIATDYEKAMIFKAQLVTTPFYIFDNGIYKVYSIENNEYKIPEVDTNANFLCYFTFNYRKLIHK